MNSIHSFIVDDIHGERLPLAQFKGKKMMIVNVASACGYTPQYQQLQELHEHFGERLAILGFPCNDFGGQEPGSAAEILDFCDTRYRVRFPLAAKVRIRQSPIHPVY
ncbi:glutathione peroxidase, partial [Arthrospira platensis SPKY1]|nr:glutathione peroxidase [Arthrospira platensis SPKY1]